MHHAAACWETYVYHQSIAYVGCMQYIHVILISVYVCTYHTYIRTYVMYVRTYVRIKIDVCIVHFMLPSLTYVTGDTYVPLCTYVRTYVCTYMYVLRSICCVLVWCTRMYIRTYVYLWWGPTLVYYCEVRTYSMVPVY